MTMSMRVSCGSRTYIDDVCTVSDLGVHLGPYLAKCENSCKLYLGEYLAKTGASLLQREGASNAERGG